MTFEAATECDGYARCIFPTREADLASPQIDEKSTQSAAGMTRQGEMAHDMTTPLGCRNLDGMPREYVVAF